MFLKLLILLGVVAMANSISIIQVIARIKEEQKFVSSLLAETQQMISTDIATKSAKLHTQAEVLKGKTKTVGQPCDAIAGNVENIQTHHLNFKPCQVTEKVETITEYLTYLDGLMASAQDLFVICTSYRNFNCQNQINSLDASLDIVHDAVQKGLDEVKTESGKCVEGRVLNAQLGLELNTITLKKCLSSK